jgi:hypothetical protein
MTPPELSELDQILDPSTLTEVELDTSPEETGESEMASSNALDRNAFEFDEIGDAPEPAPVDERPAAAPDDASSEPLIDDDEFSVEMPELSAPVERAERSDAEVARQLRGPKRRTLALMVSLLVVAAAAAVLYALDFVP